MSKKQVVTKKVKKAKTRAKAKEIKIFEGNELKNPYLQNLLKKVETGKESLKDEDETNDIDQTKENNDTAKETHLIKNAKTAQKEVAIEPEDSDNDRVENVEQDMDSVDWNALTRPSKRKSKMFESPFLKPKKRPRIVQKKFPLCAALLKESTNNFEHPSKKTSDINSEVDKAFPAIAQIEEMDISLNGSVADSQLIPKVGKVDFEEDAKKEKNCPGSGDIMKDKILENNDEIVDGVENYDAGQRVDTQLNKAVQSLTVEETQSLTEKEGQSLAEKEDLEYENAQEANDKEESDEESVTGNCNRNGRKKWTCKKCGKSFVQVTSFIKHKCDRGISKKSSLSFMFKAHK